MKFQNKSLAVKLILALTWLVAALCMR